MCIVDVKRRIIVRFLFQCNPFRQIDFSREKRASLEKLKNGLNEGFYSVNHDVSVLMKHKQHQATGIRIDLGKPHIVFPPCLVRSVGIRRSENLDD